MQFAAPDQLCRHRLADGLFAEGRKEVVEMADSIPVQRNEGISHQKSALLRRASGLDRDEQQAGLLSELLGEAVRQPGGLRAYSEVAAPDPSARQQGLHHAAKRVERHGQGRAAG